MKFKLKIVNILSFLLAAGIPFIDSKKIAGHQIGNSIQLAAMVVLLYFFLGPSFQKRNPHRNTRLPFSGFYLLFTILIVVSMALTSTGSSTGIQLVNYYLELAVVYIGFSALFFERSTMTSFYYGLMVGFSLSVFIAVMQFLKVPAFSMFSEDELNPNTSFVSETDAVDVLRIWGPFGNALSFSYYLSVAGCLLFYFFIYVKRKKIIAWSVFAMTIVAIGLTISRMALFAFLFCLALVHFLAISKTKRLVFALLTVCLLIGGAVFINSLESGNALMSRLNSTQDDFKGARLNLWESGFETWTNNIFFGTGPGNLNAKMYENGRKGIPSDQLYNTPGHVENYFLTLLYTFGLLAFIFFALFVVKYLQATAKLFMKGLKEKELAIGIPLFGSAVCLMLNNLINPAMHFDTRLQVLFLMQMAITNNLYKQFVLHPEENLQPLLPFQTLTY